MNLISEEVRIKLAEGLARYLFDKHHSHYAVGDLEHRTQLTYVDLDWDQCDMLEWINGACDNVD